MNNIVRAVVALGAGVAATIGVEALLPSTIASLEQNNASVEVCAPALVDTAIQITVLPDASVRKLDAETLEEYGTYVAERELFAIHVLRISFEKLVSAYLGYSDANLEKTS